MIVELPHGSEQVVVLAMATRPVVVSHTGVRGTCDNRRNLSDGQLRAIARNGGLVGIGFWRTAECGTDRTGIWSIDRTKSRRSAYSKSRCCLRRTKGE